MNEIFSIFNPDWWMDENNNALQWEMLSCF